MLTYRFLSFVSVGSVLGRLTWNEKKTEKNLVSSKFHWLRITYREEQNKNKQKHFKECSMAVTLNTRSIFACLPT